MENVITGPFIQALTEAEVATWKAIEARAVMKAADAIAAMKTTAPAATTALTGT